MDVKEYIESGILELYVAGKLSETENQEVASMIASYPEVKREVEEIELAIVKLTAAVSKNANSFDSIKSQLDIDDTPVQSIAPKSNNWISYTGWAASILLASGLFYTYQNNQSLQDQLEVVSQDNEFLNSEIETVQDDLANTENVLQQLRDKDIISIPLGGQGDFDTSYAKVYWNKKDNTIYLDAQGLPEAPDGKVWQVWSLTLNPLTPTSLGTIDNFNQDTDKVFAIANENESQAFGITLEPAGGSESPTMEQLHTLGIVSSTP